jgi:hypothetical protein
MFFYPIDPAATARGILIDLGHIHIRSSRGWVLKSPYYFTRRLSQLIRYLKDHWDVNNTGARIVGVLPQREEGASHARMMGGTLRVPPPP